MARHIPAAPPTFDPIPPEFTLPAREMSPCTIHSDGALGLTMWSLPSTRVNDDPGLLAKLCLAPDAPVIIGRANGGEIDYLDPRYVPSSLVPGTGRTILMHSGAMQDTYVSRGHFMLRAHPSGILLINGVPRRGGGFRPPRNWTQLLHPENRLLRPEEELLIERGAPVRISLPNGARLTIAAE